MAKDDCDTLADDRGAARVSSSRRERSSSRLEIGNDSGSIRAIYIHANAIIADETKYTVRVLWLRVVIEPPNEKERAAPEDQINVLD